MSDSSKEKPRLENVIVCDSAPVVIQLEEPSPPVEKSSESFDRILEVNLGNNGGANLATGGLGSRMGPPTSNSLLGADLFQKAASLAMPPPTSTTVKKARNLVSPGMSMVKWMKLQESRIRPPTRKKIPLSEIAKHDTESDCWMVIRNCVYDVTEYLPYHPGGIPELMKGAGKDATALFNEVHRWVNFDSILRSCLVGYLLVEVGESFDETDEDVKATLIVPLNTTVALRRPRAKFSQNETSLMFQIEAMNDDELSEDSWSVSILNRERFLLKVILKPPDLWMAHVKLLEALKDDSVTINFQNSFKTAVITLKKPSIGKWKSLGSPLQDNNQLLDSRQTKVEVDDFCSGTIIEKENITNDVILIGVEMSSSSILGVPVGFHVKIRMHEGSLARKYTTVKKLIVANASQDDYLKSADDRKVLYFIIKIYPDGQLTKEIGLLNVSSQLEVGIVAGRYDHSFLRNCDTLALFAGGSGITPFIRIIDFLKRRSLSYPIQRILLIFFNHTEQDIIWESQWTTLASTWNVFHFFPVISKSNENWTGLAGRVDSVSLFESILLKTFHHELGIPQADLENCAIGKLKAMLCGSSGFNESCVRMLNSQSIVEVNESEDVFIF